jgi:hypothetical protein
MAAVSPLLVRVKLCSLSRLSLDREIEMERVVGEQASKGAKVVLALKV